MFFVLSGYLLSRPYFISNQPNQLPRKLYPPTFYLRRFTRIWLPWFFAFCLSALAQAFLFRDWATAPVQSDWSRAFWHAPLTFENTLRQCVFMMHDPKVQLIMQDWSLGLELQVSILLPLFIFLGAIGSSWSLLAILILMVVFEPTGSYCSFILGVLLAKHGDPVVQSLRPRPMSIKIGLLMLGIIFYEGPHFCDWLQGHLLYESPHFGDWLRGHAGGGLRHFDVGTYFSAATGPGCVLILLSSLSSRRIQAVLHLPPLIFLGRISYSVYLLQFIVILCLLPPWIHLLNSWGIHRTIWLFPLNFIASVSLTVGLSALNYQWIEKPCIELGHGLSKKIQERVGKS
jgi:peptidoglycan/LPS O-acetylase OafA/YrhL